MQIVVHSVIKPELANGFYLGYCSEQIDWDRWHSLYTQTCISRQMRNVPRLEYSKIAGKVEILLSLAETFIVQIAKTGLHAGGIELQLVLHSLIALRFEPVDANLGAVIMPLIIEIMEYHQKSTDIDVPNFMLIIKKFAKRFNHMQTPVIDGNLVYPVGMIMGLHSATKW